MRKLFMAAVCALATALPLLAQSNWQTVEGPDKSFRIQGPGKPTIEKQPFRVAGKDIMLYSYLFIDVPYAFILGYGDYPAEYISKRKTEELLSLDRDRFVKTTGTKVTKQKSITYQGRAALDFVAETEDSKSLFQVRIVLVDNRVYVLAVSYPADADPALANKFLDSLQLVESKK